MFFKLLLAVSAATSLTATANAEGLYSKNSAVLQVNGKNYDKLIAKSIQVSVGLVNLHILGLNTDWVPDR